MGAASCNLPTIAVSGGLMLNGRFRDDQIGSGTHVWKFEDMVRADDMSMQEFMDVETCMSHSSGHCMTMRTASTYPWVRIDPWIRTFSRQWSGRRIPSRPACRSSRP